MAHLFILDVYVSPNRKYVNLSIIFYILDFSFFMSQDDAYFHIHQNDPNIPPPPLSPQRNLFWLIFVTSLLLLGFDQLLSNVEA